jgi:hypothetical protein
VDFRFKLRDDEPNERVEEEQQPVAQHDDETGLSNLDAEEIEADMQPAAQLGEDAGPGEAPTEDDAVTAGAAAMEEAVTVLRSLGAALAEAQREEAAAELAGTAAVEQAAAAKAVLAAARGASGREEEARARLLLEQRKAVAAVAKLQASHRR